MSSFSAVNSKYQNEIEVIPVYLLDWGWETSYNFDILEKELEINQTYLVVQDMVFDPLSSWSNKQIIDNNDLGKEKIFLQTNRYAEVNGMEFSQEEINFNKIIIGKIVGVSKLIDNTKEISLLSATNFEYHPQTPVYHITVKSIFNFIDFLQNPTQQGLLPLEAFKIREQTVISNQFNFGQLESDKNSLSNKFSIPYNIDAHRYNHDFIVIYVSLGEYSQQYYIIKREKIESITSYYLRFYLDYFVDTDTYQLVDYKLNEEQIDLLTLNNPVCKNFFAGS